MKLSATRTIRTAEVDLGNGQKFTIKYRAFTPSEWKSAYDQSEAENEFIDVLRLSKVLIETGLEDDDGNPIEPTCDGLRQVEIPVLAAMVAAVLSTELPKKAS